MYGKQNKHVKPLSAYISKLSTQDNSKDVERLFDITRMKSRASGSKCINKFFMYFEPVTC